MIFRTGLRGILALAVTLVSACGGSGSSDGTNPGPPAPPPPSNLSYPQSSAVTVGHAIAPLSPTVTGMVYTYSVSPALPAGLSLDANSGVISGTPTAVITATSYQVTARNPGGLTTATVVLTVNDFPPSVSYPTTTLSFQKGVAVQPLTPASTGGAVVTWSIQPALPAGLSLDTTNGTISGVPTAAATSTTYVVTAENSGGSATVSLSLGVHTVLLDLGHSQSVGWLRISGSRVLSVDLDNRWVLWDFATTRKIASGVAGCPDAGCVDLQGQTVAIETATGVFELRSASDGRLLGLVSPTLQGWWKLAADGSYICIPTQTGLMIYSPAGALIASRPGDYQHALPYAAPGQVQVALGPAGANVIETVTVPSGNSSISAPFEGTFNSWFLDGNRFLTNTSDTVWTYSNKVVQEDVTTLSTTFNLAGEGNWFWTFSLADDAVNIYKVGASGTPTATYTDVFTNSVIPSGSTIAILKTGGGGIIVDLSGSMPLATPFTGTFTSPVSYAAVSPSQWVVGYPNGLIFDGASLGAAARNFGYGAVLSIAGSSQRVAIATALGPVLVFNAGTLVQEETIDFPSSKVELSADGSVLAAVAAVPYNYRASGDWSIRIYSLPAAVQTTVWQYTVGNPPVLNQPLPYDASLSGPGTILGQVLDNFTSSGEQCIRKVTAVSGGPTLWSDDFTPAPKQYSCSGVPIRFSPDGTLFAVSENKSPTGITSVYSNAGTLLFAAPGWMAGWLDDDRILVNSYTADTAGNPQFQNATIFSISGPQTSKPPLPELQSLQIVSADTVYDPNTNSIYSTSSGKATWTSTSPIWTSAIPSWAITIPPFPVGAIAGSNVIFESGAEVVAESY